MTAHDATILDQFTRQAVPFSASPAVNNDDALTLLLHATSADQDDDMLDVACGPGIVVAAFAKVVRHATGIDITPAMIERAQALQQTQRLTNVTWNVGSVDRLPYPDRSFSLVTSRYAFHHFEHPAAALREMIRVCRTGGRVAVADMTASPDRDKAAALNRMERLRDPSHVRAMPLDELRRLFADAGLSPAIHRYGLHVDLDGLLSRSFPNPGDEAQVRRAVIESIDTDALGVGTRRDGDRVLFAYPITVLVATRDR